MKELRENIISETHLNYDEFELKQLIIDLNVGDKVKIQILDSTDKLLQEKEFIAKYINCHINCLWQDKGVKKDLGLF